MNTSSTVEETAIRRDAGDVSDVSLPNVSPVTRNVAIDAYRGFVMLLMMAEVLRFSEVAKSFPGNWFWKILSYNQSHVPWAGCSLHDTIQPGFSFLVGVALPYSIASRLAKGKSFGNQLGHAIWRALVLIVLGFFLRSLHQPQTYFTFEDTLTQIGLGYVFLFLLGFVVKEKWLWVALGIILFGYWLAWALYPVAGPSIRLAGGRRAVRLDPSLQRLHGALEQKRQPRQRLRSVVPESFSAHQPVCGQRRRLPDA